MTIDVSIAIAAWNAGPYIRHAISSALAQTGVSLEVIVVDDASTDDTSTVVGSIEDERVRLIRLQANGGPSAARNAAIDVARGRWIAILDADDTMAPGRLAAMIALGDQRHSQVVIDNIWVTEEGKRPYLMFPAQSFAGMGVLRLEAFLDSNRLFASQFNLGYTKPLFLRSFVLENQISYDTKIRIGEDFLFLAEALAKGAACSVLPSAGYFYAIQNGSLSRVLKPSDVAVMLEADERFRQRVRLPRSAQGAAKRRHRSLVQGLAFLTCVDHLKAKALWPALRSLAAAPSAVSLFRLPIRARLSRILRGRRQDG